VLLKIAHRGVMMWLMVDLPSDQMSLVRFQARPFRIYLFLRIYRVSLQLTKSLPKCQLTSKIAQFTPSFTCCSQLNQLHYGKANE